MEKKNNNGLLIGTIIGLLIAIIVVGCLFYTGTISFSSNTTNNNSQESNKNESKNIKIDTSKEYVYDAEYKYNNKYTMNERDKEKRTIDYYGISVEVSGNLSDLKVPYININSKDAKNANSEIETLYLNNAEEFDKCVADYKMEDGGLRADGGSNGVGCSKILTYRTYKYNEILSVIVIDSTTSTTPHIFNYHIYNFNLNTGSKILYNDMLSKLGYNKDTIINTMKTSIKNYMDSSSIGTTKGVDLSTQCHYNNDENGNPLYGTTNCYIITYKLLQESIDNNSLLYLTDNEGNLNILPILYFAFAENGDKNRYLVKVTK